MLGVGELLIWRLDKKSRAATWDSGEGARLYGGRWNHKGRTIVYCAVDPATAIIEVAVHKGFSELDTIPHMLTCALIRDPKTVHVVHPNMVPNPNWLIPGKPSDGQQKFGDALLTAHPFILIPSTVSTHSWNLCFDPAFAKTLYSLKFQEAFALDTRLNPPPP